MKILAIPGSIRKESYNKLACYAAAKLTPKGSELEVFELDDIPMFNEDLEDSLPDEVTKFVEKVREADALLFCTPEYNQMVSGAIKNACEWLSRGYSSDAVKNKPTAIMGASTGGFGAARSVNQLLFLGTILDMKVSAGLRYNLSHAADAFDGDGNLVDENVKEGISGLLKELVEIED